MKFNWGTSKMPIWSLWKQWSLWSLWKNYARVKIEKHMISVTISQTCKLQVIVNSYSFFTNKSKEIDNFEKKVSSTWRLEMELENESTEPYKLSTKKEPGKKWCVEPWNNGA